MNTTLPTLATRLCLLTAALALAGCGALTKTPYTPPEVQLPAQWGASMQAGVAPAAAGDWWRNFDDPQLDALVELALNTNNDLAAAAIRVRRAQLTADRARTALFPVLDAGASGRFERSLEDSSARSSSHSVSAGISYEADLWGRLGSQRDAAAWEAQATAADRDSARLALIGTTMNLYWQAAFLNQRLANGEQSIAYAQRTLDLVRSQYAAGAVSGLEVAEAENSLARQRASQTELQQSLVETLNALAILFNRPPDTRTQVPATLPTAEPPAVDAGIPAELLARRPDVRATELRLRSTLASADAVRTSYYPTLSLTGTLGSASAALIHVLQNPVAALGVGITLPFLQWNQMKLDIAVSEAEYEEAVVNFRQALYEAMAEVENALSNRNHLNVQADLLQEALNAARVAEGMYEVRYRAGAVPLRTWLDAQETRRAAEISVAENRLQRYSNQVLLYQALGGDTVAGTATVS